jgi:hypothetical protein
LCWREGNSFAPLNVFPPWPTFTFLHHYSFFFH